MFLCLVLKVSGFLVTASLVMKRVVGDVERCEVVQISAVRLSPPEIQL